MNNNLSDFLKNFLKNHGHFVFGSLFISKICGFISSLIIIRLLSEKDFGLINIVLSLSAIFIAFSGFGSQQILLRYGSLDQSLEEKKSLSIYLLKKGFFYQIILCSIFFICSLFYLESSNSVIFLFLAFTIRLIGYFLYNHIQSQIRIDGENREFARLNNVVNILGLIFILVLTFYFGIIGYLIAMMMMPFISLFWFKKNTFSGSFKIKFSKQEIWKYGVFASGTAVLSDSLFSLDILLLGFFLNESAVANYKAAMLIPANLTFFAIAFMQSDFPVFAKNYQNKSFFKYYISNYYKIFIPIAFVIFSLLFFMKDWIVVFFFGEKYQDVSSYFMILSGVFLVNMLLRNLYGNLLSAVGKIHYNTIISLFSILLLFCFSFLLVPLLGVLGMVISQSVTLLVSGLLMMFSFFKYYRALS